VSEAAIMRAAGAQRSATWVVATAWLLSLIGLLAVYSVSAVDSIREGHALSPAFLGQSLKLLVAIVAAWAVARMDDRRLADAARWLVPAIWIGLIAVMIFGVARNGAVRWIRIAGINLQVSEFAKLAVILGCAQFVHQRERLMGDLRRGFMPGVLWLGVTVGLVAIEPDFGTSMFILCIGMLLFFLGGMRLQHMLVAGVLTLPAFILVMISAFEHISRRLDGFFDGHQHPQVTRALQVMGSGGVSGRGLGHGEAHLYFVWEVRTDFIFSAIAEQGGFIGGLIVIALFALFAWHGLQVARFAPDDRGYLIAFGVTFMVAFQAAINISVVTGLVPPKGISLPFISFGGSGLLALSIGVGMIVSVARRTARMALAGEIPELGAEEAESGARSAKVEGDAGYDAEAPFEGQGNVDESFDELVAMPAAGVLGLPRDIDLDVALDEHMDEGDEPVVWDEVVPAAIGRE
jgi:cell division protein FtsW